MNNQALTLEFLYESLYTQYGPQGWWPLLKLNKFNVNPTGRGKFTGYHPNEYEFPNDEKDIFEIMLGTILTQNTSWINAEKALANLEKYSMLDIHKIDLLSLEKLALLIKSSGFYNQKAIKIRNLTNFLIKNPIDHLSHQNTDILRQKLLAVNGIGQETADCILLYAFKKPIFVIDAYTKRLLSRLDLIPPESTYQFCQNLFHNNIPINLEIYNEYHALIVQHCTHFCRSQPLCSICYLNLKCKKNIILKPKSKKKQKKPPKIK